MHGTSSHPLGTLIALTPHHTIHQHQIIIIFFYDTHTISTPIAHQPSLTLLRRQPAAHLHLQYHPNHQPTAADFISPPLIAHRPDAAVRWIHHQNHPLSYRSPSKKVPFYIYTGNIATLLSVSYISTLQKTLYFIKMHIILYI